MLITNVLGNHLCSGRYHTYRGVLNAVGEDMRSLWGAAVSALRDRGYYSEKEAEDDMRWIAAEIMKVG